MIDLGLTINDQDFRRSLRQFREQVQQAAGRAVVAAAREGVGLIVQRTGEPPIPRAKRYRRTRRMISGWAPAGNFLGIPVPAALPTAKGANEGSYQFEVGSGGARFTAINSVPYALAVELTGTWIVPPPNEQRRAPYLTVANSIKEMESKGSMERHFSNEWDAIV